MARTRTGASLIDDAYRKADLVNATDRHPRSDVLRYVNQGATELYDLLIESRGRAYYAKKPAQTIATAAGTTRYALDASFYRLSAARVAGPGGYTLDPFTPQDEPWLREPGGTAAKPSHYEIQPGFIELLPVHGANWSVVIDYVPVFVDLADDTSTFDGINGWEEYIACFAAKCMATRDEEWPLADAMRKDMAALAVRIAKLAPHRDAFRAERVKNVRGTNHFMLRGRGR